jgi:hypothetical protein
MLTRREIFKAFAAGASILSPGPSTSPSGSSAYTGGTEGNDLTVDALTNKEKAGLFWGFVWRGLVIPVAALVSAVVLGAITGFVLGIAGHLLGFDPASFRSVIKVACGFLGLVLGFWFVWLYIRSLFRANFGAYRLRLVRKDVGDAATRSRPLAGYRTRGAREPA